MSTLITKRHLDLETYSVFKILTIFGQILGLKQGHSVYENSTEL